MMVASELESKVKIQELSWGSQNYVQFCDAFTKLSKNVHRAISEVHKLVATKTVGKIATMLLVVKVVGKAIIVDSGLSSKLYGQGKVSQIFVVHRNALTKSEKD